MVNAEILKLLKFKFWPTRGEWLLNYSSDQSSIRVLWKRSVSGQSWNKQKCQPVLHRACVGRLWLHIVIETFPWTITGPVYNQKHCKWLKSIYKVHFCSSKLKIWAVIGQCYLHVDDSLYSSIFNLCALGNANLCHAKSDQSGISLTTTGRSQNIKYALARQTKVNHSN